LDALNKLGDGSLQSSILVDDANLRFCQQLLQALGSPLNFGKTGATWLVLSSTATNRLTLAAQKICRQVYSLKSGQSQQQQDAKPRKSDVCIVLSPSVSADYEAAHRLATDGVKVVLVNGLAKVG
jgi:hypothetical protein